MRVPLSWLRELVDVDLSPEQLAEQLTRLGMEVKGIERRGSDWQNVVVGELLAVEKHPRADRLSLTRVTTGSGAPLVRMPTIAWASKPSPSGLVTPVTWRMLSSQRRE